MKTTIRNSEISLSERPVTGSPNGYLEPYIGKFFYGFENIDQAKYYADETGGQVRIGIWKDGWSNCVLGETPYGEFSPDIDDYGDDYQVIDTAKELNDAAYFMLVDSMDEEDRQAWKESGDKLLSECAKINWEKDSVILYRSDFYDIVPKKSMSFHHDSRHLVIGVVIFSDQD